MPARLRLFQKVVPWFHGRCLPNGNAYLPQDGRIESLPLHVHRYLVDAGHILALHHALQIDITERCHLQAHRVAEVALCSKHEDVRLYTHALQLLHGVLCGFGLQFVGGLQVRHIRQMHTYRIAPQLPAQLSDSLHKRRTLDVANGSSNLCDDKVQLLVV